MENNYNNNKDSNKIWRILLIVAYIFFEVYAGVRLLTDPEGFTNSVIIIFGIIMVIAGIVSLVRALKAKSHGLPSTLGIVSGIVDILIGAACIAFSQKVMNMFPVFVVIYGIIMVIMGINKLGQWAVLNDLHIPRAWIMLVTAILTIVMGVIAIVYPLTTEVAVYTMTAVFLIVAGVADLFTLIFSFFF